MWSIEAGIDPRNGLQGLFHLIGLSPIVIKIIISSKKFMESYKLSSKQCKKCLSDAIHLSVILSSNKFEMRMIIDNLP